MKKLLLQCIKGAYSDGTFNEDGTYGITSDPQKAYRYTKVQLDSIFSQFTDMKNLFDVIPDFSN